MGKEEVLLHITPWERSVLQSLAEGRSPAEVALTLGMSEHEIQHQLSALFSRMGAASLPDAVAVAFRRGIIPGAPNLAALPL